MESRFAFLVAACYLRSVIDLNDKLVRSAQALAVLAAPVARFPFRERSRRHTGRAPGVAGLFPNRELSDRAAGSTYPLPLPVLTYRYRRSAPVFSSVTCPTKYGLRAANGLSPITCHSPLIYAFLIETPEFLEMAPTPRKHSTRIASNRDTDAALANVFVKQFPARTEASSAPGYSRRLERRRLRESAKAAGAVKAAKQNRKWRDRSDRPRHIRLGWRELLSTFRNLRADLGQRRRGARRLTTCGT